MNQYCPLVYIINVLNIVHRVPTRMPVIPYEVISYDLFSNLVRLIKLNLFHNYTVLIRI